jgi:N-acetylglucosaminyldiphosphoundecaprenol N-acetyl-beta-D-mannosaminyltransferase
MREDAGLSAAVTGNDLVLADGMSIVWASRVLGQPLPERVAGIDLFMELLSLADGRRRSIYLLGATDEVLARVREVIGKRFARAVIAGSRNGYFADAEWPAVAEDIRATGADMLFLGMSSPKKELFMARFGRACGVRICHGVGGSFDVLAGIVKRAPRLWQRLGCEWLYRALQEPRRLMGRYLATNGRFMGLVIRAWFARHSGPPSRPSAERSKT